MLTAAPAPPPRAIGMNLVLFFAFALPALVLLTHTLVEIKQTQASVAEAVRPAVGGIAANTALLPALARTQLLTARLASSSHGINDSLTATVSATRDVDIRIAHVRSDSQSIEASVAGIATSTSATYRGVTDLATEVRATHRSAAGIASALDGASGAVATLPDGLAIAVARLRLLATLIPSITQRASTITAGLRDVDRHLVDINNNALIRLTNLLQLSDVLTGTPSGG
jgi:uncharacterized phage infection (PIP) family protein YhgE